MFRCCDFVVWVVGRFYKYCQSLFQTCLKLSIGNNSNPSLPFLKSGVIILTSRDGGRENFSKENGDKLIGCFK